MPLSEVLVLVHIAILVVAGMSLLVADKVGFAWMRGKTPTVNPKTAARLHLVSGLALSGMIITGLMLFWPMREFLLGNIRFWVKMAYVGALVLNSFVINHLMKTAVTTPFASLSRGRKTAFVVSGAVSFLGWIGAGLGGLFLLD